MTLDQLAGKSGIDRGTISRIELGHVSPRIDTIDCLCQAMNTTLPEFFGQGNGWTSIPPQAGPPPIEQSLGDLPVVATDLYWPVPATVWQSLVDVVERFEALMANSGELALVMDQAGRVIYISPGGEGLLGHKRADLLGTSVLDLIHADDRPRFHAALTGAGPGAASSKHYRLRHSSGVWHTFACTLTDHLHSPSIRARILNAALI